ncbi:MAG: DUF1553 domain-containing protein [Gemmataceae bacterium]|nr:DUF1553 domain-containing protein [Gemmataceae bacterium]
MAGFTTTIELLLCLALPFQPSADLDFFEKKIRPVLADHCYKCHSEKSQPAKGGLKLDTRAGVLKGGATGPAIHPGKPEASLLLKAIRHDSSVEAMPPGKPQLSQEVIADFTRWITRGAHDPRVSAATNDKTNTSKHWAFQPLKKPPVPAGGYAHEIDRFLHKKLQEAGLSFSKLADKRALIRRATFDLHGLPPTPEEVVAFEKDNSPLAYARVVERLLDSPRYGERWARHWLDIARYADNKGYVFFEEQSYPWAFTYRDYVINALNTDLPYNRFIEQQLAADLLPQSDGKTLAALGFLTVGGHFMNNTHDILDDRMDVITRGLMGLTATCARCHDHKYDPVSMADYYGLYGVLRSSAEPLVPPLYETQADNESARKITAEIAAKEKTLRDFVVGKHRDLVEGGRKRAGEYLLAAHKTRNKPADDDFMLLSDPGDLNPSMTTRWRVFLEETKKNASPAWQLWHALAVFPEDQFSQKAGPLLEEFREKKQGNPVILAAFSQTPKSMEETARVYGKILAAVDQQWREACQKGKPAVLENPHEEELRAALYGAKAPPDASVELDWGFLSLFPERATQEQYKKLLKELETASMKGPARAMVLNDLPAPYEPRVFLRGNPSHLGMPVSRRLPVIANPKANPLGKGSGRLELARQIASPDNPLTARTIVNRVWLHHFGRGITATPDDLGTRGDPPSHPELLDYLASEFMAHGWSLKLLHRRIMTSIAYQQQSIMRKEGLEKDPENKLLWRMNSRRLEFEALHDSLLAVSGSLDARLGGPASGLFSNRRTIYAMVNRLEFPNLLTTFDVPHPAAPAGLRNTTTVPPQALFLLNDPWVKKMAQQLASHARVKAAPKTEEQVEALFSLVLQRKPGAEELKKALTLLGEKPQIVDLAHALFLTNEFMFIE